MPTTRQRLSSAEQNFQKGRGGTASSDESEPQAVDLSVCASHHEFTTRLFHHTDQPGLRLTSQVRIGNVCVRSVVVVRVRASDSPPHKRIKRLYASRTLEKVHTCRCFFPVSLPVRSGPRGNEMRDERKRPKEREDFELAWLARAAYLRRYRIGSFRRRHEWWSARQYQDENVVAAAMPQVSDAPRARFFVERFFSTQNRATRSLVDLFRVRRLASLWLPVHSFSPRSARVHNTLTRDGSSLSLLQGCREGSPARGAKGPHEPRPEARSRR